jgi:hypothetical protein
MMRAISSMVDTNKIDRTALLGEIDHLQRIANCDCVPSLASSRTCPKCGRKAIIPHQTFLEANHELYELRLKINRIEQLYNLLPVNDQDLQTIQVATARHGWQPSERLGRGSFRKGLLVWVGAPQSAARGSQGLRMCVGKDDEMAISR